MKKKLTIIIPHYKNWNMLSELLLTIPLQEIEVIVIDDHSPENTKRIPEMQQKFPLVKFLVNSDLKKGAGSARNEGLKVATGEWLLFADSDDKFLPNFIEKIQPFLTSNYDLVYFTPTSFFENKGDGSLRHSLYQRYIEQYIETKNSTSEILLRYNYNPPWSKMIRRELVETNSIHFDETMVANDVMFSAKVGHHANRIYATTEKIYSVRQTAGSLTSIISVENFRTRFDIWVELILYVRNNIDTKEFKKLNISTSRHILAVFENKLGVSTFFYILKTAYSYNIPLVDKRIYNLKFLINSFLNRKKLVRSTKRTVIKERKQ